MTYKFQKNETFADISNLSFKNWDLDCGCSQKVPLDPSMKLKRPSTPTTSLGPADLTRLSIEPMQKGLLFTFETQLT